ncbi:MAG: fasciclin domain-containing protein [Bacteroidales bacterium]
MTKLIYLFIVLLAALIFSCDNNGGMVAGFEDLDEFTVYDYMKEDSTNRFSSFLSILEKGGLDKTLSAYNPEENGYTLFLPDNDAVSNFINQSQDFSSLDDILNDPEYAAIFSRYHVINMVAHTNDFPFGAFPKPTLSNDFLTVSFIIGTDTSYYKINNQATVSRPNIEVANGFVHEIDIALTPITLTSYQWLERNHLDFSILKEAVDLTGLQPVIDFIQKNEENRPVVTVLAEPNSAFNKQGIYSIDDLKERISPDNTDYTNSSNPLYNFVGYHFLTASYFIDDFVDVSTNYNTYGEVPVIIDGTGLDILINKGKEVFDTIIVQSDTTIIDFIGFDYDASNVVTQSGSIHIIDRVLQQQRPSRTTRNFQFTGEEPFLNAFRQEGGGTLLIEDTESLSRIDWSGADLSFVYTGSENNGAWQNDYLILNGDFVITYTIPRIVQGTYDVELRAEAFNKFNAIVEVFVDGNKIGGLIDLTSGGKATGPFNNKKLGTIVFSTYSEHTIEVRSLVPGRFLWDAVRFTPN